MPKPARSTASPAASKPSPARVIAESIFIAVVTAVFGVFIKRFLVDDISVAVAGGVLGGVLAVYFSRLSRKRWP